jgi:hypothetical protein
MLSIQEISDRLELEELLVRYSHAIDARDWDAFSAVFTPDAVVDYRAFGGPRGGVPEIRDYLRRALTHVLSSQHIVSNSLFTIRGDRASGRTICQCPMLLDIGEGKTQVIFQGLWYEDKFARAEQGWRIQERVEEKSYAYNVPPGFHF